MMKGKQKMKTFMGSPLVGNPEQKGFVSGTMHSFNPSANPHYFQEDFNQNFIDPNSSNQLQKEPSENFPYNSAEMLKKSPSTHNRYPTEISLMKSDISVASTIHLDQQLPRTLVNLEMNLTESILGLREEKISLMQDYNQMLDDKYQIQREINKLEKLTERSSSDPDEMVASVHPESPKLEIDPLLMKNQQLKAQYKEKQKNMSENKSALSDIMQNIEALQSQSKLLEEEIKNITQTHEEKRFETFFPQPQQKKPNQLQLFRQLDELKKKKKELLERLAYGSSGHSRQTLFMLIDQKNRLERDCEQLIIQKEKNTRKKNFRGEVQELKKRVEQEQRSKHLFFMDLQHLKEEMQKLKRENQALRRS